jgi:hypothetical protein
MSKNKELRFPTYPVANFIPSFSSVGETLLVHQTGGVNLISSQPNGIVINTAVDAIQAPSQITGLAAWIASQSYQERVIATAADNKLPWLRKPICRHLSTFDALFSVFFFGSVFGTIYVLTKFL